MPQVEVKFFREGKLLRKAPRPVHVRPDGTKEVTFEGKRYRLARGNSVNLDRGGREPAPAARPARTPQREARSVRDVGTFPASLDERPRLRDEAQVAVIEAGAERRLLVQAGPGTGKTFVACQRVAWLTSKERVAPSSIWLISFTRTAVQEIRNRLLAMISDKMIAGAVQVATLDSIAWQMNRSINRQARLTGSFDDNIATLIGELAGSEAVREHISRLGHLIIDEAQDVVGPRADLLVELIEKLPASCGVTVFADDAQAIYGFADGDEDDRHRNGESVPALSARIRARTTAQQFSEIRLDTVHRTEDPGLISIFTKTRATVLSNENNARWRNLQVRAQLEEHAHATHERGVEELPDVLPPDSFVLYRRRAEALMASSMLFRKGLRLRVRMSGFPVTTVPWIAAALSESAESRLTGDSFRRLWTDRVQGTALAMSEPEDAWQRLLAIAPDRARRVVELRTLRDRLAGRPPLELIRTDLGMSGPLIGTIHAAKGREADVTCLMLPNEPNDDATASATDEETRVLFVGATRARRALVIGKGFGIKAASLESGRIYRFFWAKRGSSKRPMCSVEIGRDGDITADGLAGRRFFSNGGAVRAAQARLRDLAVAGGSLCAFMRKIDQNWRMCLAEKREGPVLAVLSDGLSKDLWDISEHAHKFFRMNGRPKSPAMLSYIWLVGLTTLAVRHDSPAAGMLLEPWQKSGLLLAPLIFGFCPFSPRSAE